MLVTQRSGQHAKAEGHQNHDQASGLTLRVTVRPWSAVAFTLFYVGLCRILGLVVSCRRGQSDKDMEIMVLRHQESQPSTSTGTISAHRWHHAAEGARSLGCTNPPHR